MNLRATSSASLLACLLAAACSDSSDPAGPDAGGSPDGGDPQVPFEIELFGPVGHEFRFLVSEEQATQMEKGGFDPGTEDQYELGGGTFADDLIVTDAADGQTTRLGKIELKLIGQSTARPWNRIPNLRVDLDEFQDGLDLDGVEHFRLNNGQVSGIFREAIALRLWGAMGYPVPRTSFAWAEAPNQWGEDTRVPYTLVEVYKPEWCERTMGGCANVWEAYGEVDALRGQCQFDACDEGRLDELIDAVHGAPYGEGFTAATADYVDWDAFRTFQCMSWISGTGDDYLHNQNNVVMVERTDGKFQLLPYSVDISAGMSWYPDVKLLGQSALAVGCQNDSTCWTALLARCDELLTRYEAMDVVGTIVDPAIAQVEGARMARPGDDLRADELRAWYAERAAELRADKVWESQPCVSDETCADRDDGLTFCDGVCSPPPPRCDASPCPGNMWCDEGGQCHPF